MVHQCTSNYPMFGAFRPAIPCPLGRLWPIPWTKVMLPKLQMSITVTTQKKTIYNPLVLFKGSVLYNFLKTHPGSFFLFGFFRSWARQKNFWFEDSGKDLMFDRNNKWNKNVSLDTAGLARNVAFKLLFKVIFGEQGHLRCKAIPCDSSISHSFLSFLASWLQPQFEKNNAVNL